MVLNNLISFKDLSKFYFALKILYENLKVYFQLHSLQCSDANKGILEKLKHCIKSHIQFIRGSLCFITGLYWKHLSLFHLSFLQQFSSSIKNLNTVCVKTPRTNEVAIKVFDFCLKKRYYGIKKSISPTTNTIIKHF